MSQRALLLELVGPVVGDPRVLRHALLDLALRRGVTLRPGALDGVEGGTAGWVLETLLGGHGRDTTEDDVAALRSTWARLAAEELAVGPDTLARLADWTAAGHRVGLLATVPHEAVPTALREWLVPGSDRDREGAPRPDAIRAWLAAHGLEAAAASAVAASPAALLAVSAARIGRVLRHGDAPGSAPLPCDGRVAGLADLRDWLD